MKEQFPIVDVKKYGGKQVAIAGGKIIATGRTLTEVIRRAKKKQPSRPTHEIHILSVPKTLAAIYHA